MATGGCHCGAIRYEIDGAPKHSAICHCTDCRRSAGAPMVGWAGVETDSFALTRGTPKVYASSADGRRYFCDTCGSGLYFVNEVMLPGLVDVQIGTLDDPEALPPKVHIQTAERLSWTSGLDTLPSFDRYPPG